MSSCCVILPIGKELENFLPEEILAFNQVFRVLKKHTIYLLCPSKVDASKLLQRAASLGGYPEVMVYDEGFGSIERHNKMQLSSSFYKLFEKHEFMLMHHLDAYVFADELDYWCRLGYDYIGAPWFEGWADTTKESKMIGVGNGGFSLRNIKTSLKAIEVKNSVKYLLLGYQVYRKLFLDRIISFDSLTSSLKRKRKIYCNFKELAKQVSFKSLTNEGASNDLFFGIYFPAMMPHYKLAPIEDAVKFAWESNPSKLYELNNGILPFGCHAWFIMNREFWTPFIQSKLQLHK